jgi:hypothetical protein
MINLATLPALVLGCLTVFASEARTGTNQIDHVLGHISSDHRLRLADDHHL